MFINYCTSVGQGRATWGGGGGGGGGGCGGCNTPQKKEKRGAQLAGRGPWHAGIAKFCFAKDFGNFCFRKNNVDPLTLCMKYSQEITHRTVYCCCCVLYSLHAAEFNAEQPKILNSLTLILVPQINN
jgi:hypothetical protein